MTVSELIEKLQGVPGDTPVLVPAHDHAYQDCGRVTVTTGLHDRRAGWTEDYGEETTPEAEYGKRRPIVVIGG